IRARRDVRSDVDIAAVAVPPLWYNGVPTSAARIGRPKCSGRDAMAKRALLIGSQTFGLGGVDGDVTLMAETLSDRGFAVETRIGDAASRAGVIAAYERLIADTPSGSTDPVVVYYSGHGGRIPLPGWQD